MSVTTFEAKYPGTCQECGGEIEPGDEVVYLEDKLVHADVTCSAQRESTVVVENDICKKCWTTKSVTGACACEDD